MGLPVQMAVTQSLLSTIEDFLWFLIALAQPQGTGSHDVGEPCVLRCCMLKYSTCAPGRVAKMLISLCRLDIVDCWGFSDPI